MLQSKFVDLPLVYGTSVCDGADCVRKETFRSPTCCSCDTCTIEEIFSHATKNINSNLNSYTQQRAGAYRRASEAFKGDLFVMHSFMSTPPVGKNPTTKSYFWRRIPIDVGVKAT